MSWFSDLLGSLFRRDPAPVEPPKVEPVDPETGDVAIDKLYELHEAARRSEGLPSLSLESRIGIAAQLHAEWMASTLTMSHTGPLRNSPADRLKAAGYRFTTYGENVAAGQPNATEVFRAWWRSAGHRRNILRSGWRHIGLGVARGRDGRRYWCVVFASDERQAVSYAAANAVEDLRLPPGIEALR